MACPACERRRERIIKEVMEEQDAPALAAAGAGAGAKITPQSPAKDIA